MAGQQLAQLLSTCLGFEAGLNAYLVAAGLDALAQVATEHEAGKVADRPLLTVSLDGGRSRTAPTIGKATPRLVAEGLDVTFRLRLDGTQADALAYEGALAAYLKDRQADVSAGVTDAACVDAWQLTGGSLEVETGRKNSTAWLVTVTVAVALQWE